MLKELGRSLSPKSYKCFCKLFLEKCNSLVDDPHIDEEIALGDIDGTEFLEEFMAQCSVSDFKSTKINTILKKVATRNLQRHFPNEVSLFTKAILRYHKDCAACRAHIHKELHQKEDTRHTSRCSQPCSVVANGTCSLSGRQLQCVEESKATASYSHTNEMCVVSEDNEIVPNGSAQRDTGV